MTMVNAGAALARRGGALRLLALVGLPGLSLAACASTTPEMAAAGIERPHPVAATAQRWGARPDADSSDPAVSAMNEEGERALNGGRYKIGAPYQVAGVWYVPAEQPTYDEVGVASWYGDEFNGQATANGERFDMYSASAAHATLPMPSIVEVTNLDNGRSMRVRLNDRGPYKAGRIIDLSRGAAEQLGYMEKGTARVRVRYIGPARLDGSLDPLFVAQDGPPPALRPEQLAAASFTQTPAPASRPTGFAAAAADGFAVQAGAFSDREKAQRIAAALQTAGAAAVRPIDMPDRTLYRVVVGPWPDAAQAQAARAQVAALGYADARVVKAF